MQDLQFAIYSQIAIEQDVVAAAIMTALFTVYLHASDVHQHTFKRGRQATLFWDKASKRFSQKAT